MSDLVHPVHTVLKALFQGHDVKLGNETYRMSGDDEVGVAEGENVRIYNDRDLAIGLNEFIKLCTKMPEQDLVGLRASVALTGLKRSQRRGS